MSRIFKFRNANRERPLAQIASVRAAFPGLNYRVTRQGGVEWNGRLRPTDDSPWYVIRILHALDRAPRVWVLSPPLTPNPPHVYASDSNRLCLYWPEEWCWTPKHSLATTIIPWAALWLYFYEVWQVTGEWLGPSSHHQGEK